MTPAQEGKSFTYLPIWKLPLATKYSW